MFKSVESREGRPQRNSEALQAVRLGLGVCVWESHIHGEGPEGEGGGPNITQGTRKLYTVNSVDS